MRRIIFSIIFLIGFFALSGIAVNASAQNFFSSQARPTARGHYQTVEYHHRYYHHHYRHRYYRPYARYYYYYDPYYYPYPYTYYYGPGVSIYTPFFGLSIP